jgi:hypothetical protein
MRVRTRVSGNPNDSSTVCTSFGSGETEDYYVYVTYPLGIEKLADSKYQVAVYPNPATNQITIAANFSRNENINADIFSISGSLISKTESKYTGEPLSINISALEAGIYFVRISTKEYTSTKKIIISK